MADTEPQPNQTPSLQVSGERVIVPPLHANALTDRLKTDCEFGGLDLIDRMVDEIGIIKDSKDVDITEKARGQLQKAWSDTFKYTLEHQRAGIRTNQKPELREAADSLELIARLRDSHGTMSAMMGRKGIQSDSWSKARKTLHTEVMGRYDGMISTLIHTLWGHSVAPDVAADKQRPTR